MNIKETKVGNLRNQAVISEKDNDAMNHIIFQGQKQYGINS